MRLESSRISSLELYLHDDAPEHQLHLVRAAFQRASRVREVADGGFVSEIVASCIVRLVSRGQDDARTVADQVLKRLGLPTVPEH
jgi:hypothetical protein